MTIFDTGAEVSVITHSLALSLNLSIDFSNMNLGAFGGSQVKTLGITKIRIQEDKKPDLETEVLVVERIEPGVDLLLGWPFMVKNNFKLDCDSKFISFSNFNPISYFDYSPLSTSCEIRAKSDFTIPSRSEIFISFNHSDFCKFLKYSHITSSFITPSNTLLNTPLRLGTGYISCNNRKLLISNWSHGPVTLRKGALIGHAIFSKSYEIFSLSQEEEGINDSNIYLPSPIANDFNEAIDDNKLLSKNEFIELLSSLLAKNQDNENFLNSAQKAKLTNFLLKWRCLFSKNPKNPGATTKTTCRVSTDPSDLTPIRSVPYRTSPKALEELRKQVNDMLSSGITRKSKSPWAFPVVLAMKSDGSWRFCVDYSKLNKHVPRDSFPLPNMEDHLDRLGKAKIFTVIDLASGFWQIPIEEKDKEKLAFITPFGTYEWNYMPFGFINAPSIFQRAISETLDPELYVSCLVYVDDIIIFSDDFESHLKDLDRVFSLLNSYNWKIKLSKCQFAQDKINYLGHCISNGRIFPLERNIDKLLKMKKPSNHEEMISFLGVTAYYKKFIQGYDYIIKPLRDLTKTKSKFSLDDHTHALHAYEKILKIFASQPVLRLPDFSRPFIVKTDTSAFAWGAALVQVHEGLEHPVQFASGTLISAQRNWAAWKREMYGSLRAITKWNPYLLGEDFILVTDHQANVTLMDPLKKHPPIINNWKMILSQYRYKVIHRPGNTLYLEDALSRSPSLFSLSEIFDDHVPEIKVEDLISAQSSDDILSKIIHFLKSKTEFDKKLTEKLHLSSKHFEIENDVLFYIENISKFPSRRLKRFCLAPSQQLNIFKSLHDHSLAGHMGFERFWSNISSNYWYPDLYTNAKKFYDNCHICNMNKPIKKHNSQIVPVIANSPFDILQVDHIIVNSVPKKDDYNYILVVTDVFSKKSWFLPSKTLSAVETFELLFIHVFSPFFFPKHFQSDLGSAFDNELSSLLVKATKISHKFALPNQKGTTGQVENRNKLAESIIRKYLKEFDQKDWHKYCWTAQYAYNKSVNSTHFLEPDYVVFGMKPFSPIDLNFSSYSEFSNLKDEVKHRLSKIEKAWKNVSNSIKEQVDVMKKDRSSYFSPHSIPSFKPDDLIVIKRDDNERGLNRKFLSQNVGPFKIISVSDNNITFQLTPTSTFVIHQDNVSHYNGPLKPFPPNYFTPLFNEIIPISIPERKKLSEKVKIFPDSKKKEYDIKTIVGQRINHYWLSTKTWYPATVIGYNSELTHNLVFYDEPTQGAIESCDYYKAYLFKTPKTKKVESWSLIQ